MCMCMHMRMCVCECVCGRVSWCASQECHQSKREKKKNKPKMLWKRVKYFRASLTCLVDVATDIANR